MKYIKDLGWLSCNSAVNRELVNPPDNSVVNFSLNLSLHEVDKQWPLEFHTSAVLYFIDPQDKTQNNSHEIAHIDIVYCVEFNDNDTSTSSLREEAQAALWPYYRQDLESFIRRYPISVPALPYDMHAMDQSAV